MDPYTNTVFQDVSANSSDAAKAAPFKRKYVGHGIRYRNTDIIRFILADNQEEKPSDN